MTTRFLPVEEWPRLAGTLLETVWPGLDPASTRIIVVEEDGQILGCVTLFQAWHLDGAWIHPDYRRRVGVMRRLLKGLTELLRIFRPVEVVVTAHNKTGRNLCQSVGPVVELTCDHFAVDVRHRWQQ